MEGEKSSKKKEAENSEKSSDVQESPQEREDSNGERPEDRAESRDNSSEAQGDAKRQDAYENHEREGDQADDSLKNGRKDSPQQQGNSDGEPSDDREAERGDSSQAKSDAERTGTEESAGQEKAQSGERPENEKQESPQAREDSNGERSEDRAEGRDGSLEATGDAKRWDGYENHEQEEAQADKSLKNGQKDSPQQQGNSDGELSDDRQAERGDSSQARSDAERTGADESAGQEKNRNQEQPKNGQGESPQERKNSDGARSENDPEKSNDSSQIGSDTKQQGTGESAGQEKAQTGEPSQNRQGESPSQPEASDRNATSGQSGDGAQPNSESERTGAAKGTGAENAQAGEHPQNGETKPRMVLKGEVSVTENHPPEESQGAPEKKHPTAAYGSDRGNAQEGDPFQDRQGEAQQRQNQEREETRVRQAEATRADSPPERQAGAHGSGGENAQARELQSQNQQVESQKKPENETQAGKDSPQDAAKLTQEGEVKPAPRQDQQAESQKTTGEETQAGKESPRDGAKPTQGEEVQSAQRQNQQAEAQKATEEETQAGKDSSRDAEKPTQEEEAQSVQRQNQQAEAEKRTEEEKQTGKEASRDAERLAQAGAAERPAKNLSGEAGEKAVNPAPPTPDAYEPHGWLGKSVKSFNDVINRVPGAPEALQWGAKLTKEQADDLKREFDMTKPHTGLKYIIAAVENEPEALGKFAKAGWEQAAKLLESKAARDALMQAEERAVKTMGGAVDNVVHGQKIPMPEGRAPIPEPPPLASGETRLPSADAGEKIKLPSQAETVPVAGTPPVGKSQSPKMMTSAEEQLSAAAGGAAPDGQAEYDKLAQEIMNSEKELRRREEQAALLGSAEGLVEKDMKPEVLMQKLQELETASAPVFDKMLDHMADLKTAESKIAAAIKTETDPFRKEGLLRQMELNEKLYERASSEHLALWNLQRERARSIIEVPEAMRSKIVVDSSAVAKHANYGKIQEGEGIFRRYTSDKLDAAGSMTIENVTNASERCHFDGGSMKIRMTQDEMRETTAAHEMMHFIETKCPKILQKSYDLFNQRTRNLVPERLMDKCPGSNYGPNEWFIKDNFPSDGYAGKICTDGAGKWRYSEILSVGIEQMHLDPIQFAKEHPDYFEHMIKSLNGHY